MKAAQEVNNQENDKNGPQTDSRPARVSPSTVAIIASSSTEKQD
jgi:hypothetical protein